MRTKTDILALVKELPDLVSDQKALQDFGALDGMWAPQTQEAYDQLGCTSANFSPLWLMTPQSWRCPVCERGKQNILRNAGGVLLGRIVEHHDHIDQFLEDAVRTTAKKLGVQASEDINRHINHRCKPFLHRFQPTIICEDCNNADPAAMANCTANGSRLDFFSFSPLEISQFIHPRPRLAHEIDFGKAKELMAKQSETHLFRLKVGRTLVERALEGRFWAEMPKGLGKHEAMILANEALVALSISPAGVQLEGTSRRSIERIQAFQSSLQGKEEDLERKRQRQELRAERRAERDAKKAAGPAPNQGKTWNKDDEQELLSLFKQELPLAEIALKLGRKQGGIKSRLSKLGIELDPD